MLACKLRISGIRKLWKSFEDIGLPHSLKIMQISSCESLMHVARYQIPPSLRRLSIWNCDNLKSLIENEEEGCVLFPSFDCLEYLSIDSVFISDVLITSKANLPGRLNS
ncbi:hypothetical protein M0R45_016227 [Rubus argutus]|uniref:CC-NBS-LRR protein n=1 Tax=Rubus argutus TaxID=59490 RepID=A0AAW1XS80_RUBAR